ncbi:MAG: aminopeptidase P family protein [Anaerolineae bacterium]|nr:aminopeptidase P family protein [Anaerolineae bacterium]
MALSAEMVAIVQEKTAQAVEILNEHDVDLWVTLVRETSQVKDPVLDLLLGFNLTWLSALLIHRDGRCKAIVGRFDAANFEQLGAYDDVIVYDQAFQPVLRRTLEAFEPATIAINTSRSDPAADGLTHGLYLRLMDTLAGTPYASRLKSAEAIIGALRGRKTASELELIEAAVVETQTAIAELHQVIRPGVADTEVADVLHGYATARGYGTAWDWDGCPVVTVGPESVFGHGMPTGLRAAPGNLVHIDFGLRRRGFVADLQRTWYLRTGTNAPVPEEVIAAWEAVTRALEAGRAALRPGARGWEVDAAARTSLVGDGYPEFMHAFGHHVGRTAHDGATVLGPKWERYGTSIEGVIEAGNVFAIELGVAVPGRGYVSREEDVVVTSEGARYLGEPQDELWVID